MIVSTWVDVLRQASYNMLFGVVSFLPSVLLAVVIFVIGWFLASLLGRAVMEAIRVLKVDHALKSAGVEEIVTRAGYRLNSGMFIGSLVKWFIIIVFLVASLQALGLTQVTFFLQQIVVGFLPNVIIATLIVLVAAVVADVAQGFVTGAARAAGITASGFAGTLARWAIWIFAILAVLAQLQIAQAIIQTLFTGLVVALSLGFGLAFGLGGQESASRILDRVREQIGGHK